jgi:hypothetical protein
VYEANEFRRESLNLVKSIKSFINFFELDFAVKAYGLGRSCSFVTPEKLLVEPINAKVYFY